MRHLLLALIATAAAAATAPALAQRQSADDTQWITARAADERNFTIVNGTGYEISFIGVNPPGDNDFGENELGSGLANGGSVYVKFNGADKGCFWNIKVKWTGYAEQVFFEGLDLCSI